jgi:DNA-nicking Smr family endonuclease
MSAEGRRPGRRHLSDDERTLWRDVTRSVRPLRRLRIKSEAADGETASPKSSPRPAKVPKAETPTRAASPRPAATVKPKPAPGLAPIERRQKKKLARGTEPIDARLDLHGCTQSEAHAALLQFLRRAQHNSARYVLVITGKGRAGGDGLREAGVLKRQVPQWLAMPEFRGYVVGFEDAAASHGGEGALYVRLRRAR